MNNETILKWTSKQPPIHITNHEQEVQILYQELIERKSMVFCNGAPYIWTGTYYRCVVDQDIAMIITNLVCAEDRVELNPSTPKTVFQKLCVDSRLQVDIEGEAERNRMFVNTKKGIYDIVNQVLIPHDGTRKFNYELDFEYIKDAAIDKAPAFRDFVESSLGLEKLKFLLQIIGYCCSSLIGGRCYFELIGPGMRGKSQIIAFLESVVDEVCRSSISFSDLCRKEYLIKLAGKLLNTCADNDPEPMNNISLLKRICSAESLTARDLYKSAITFRAIAKLIFATNHSLEFVNPDDEIIDRLIPLCFNKAIPREKRDPDLLNKLIGEKNVIMSLAVDTLHDLVESGYKFNLPDDSKEYLQRRRDELHPERAFLERYTILDPEGQISSRELWETFQKFCTDNTIQPIGQKKFLAQVEAYADGIIKTTLGPAHKRYNGFKGLRYKNAKDFESEDEEV